MILSIDLGTSGLKAALIDRQGLPVNFYRQRHQHYRQWADLAFLNEVIGSYSIEAIAISSQGPTLIPLLKDGQTGPAMYYYDNNNTPISGQPSFFLPKINYIKNNQPELYQQTKIFLTAGDYLIYCLTGAVQTALPTEDGRYHQALWNQEQLNAYGIEATKLAPYSDQNKPLAFTNGSYGLPKNIPVIYSTFDFLASLLGSGCIEPSLAGNRTGSSEGLNFFAPAVPSEKPFPQAPWRLTPHIISGAYNLGLVYNDSLKLLEILSRHAGYDTYQEWAKQLLLTDAAPALSFSDKLWPWLDESSPEDLLNQTRNLSPFLQSYVIMDYYLSSFRKILKASQSPIREIRISGGVSFSKELNQFKADRLGFDVVSLQNPHAELTGNAVMAYYKLGLYASPQKAVEQLVKIKTCYRQGESFL